MTDTTPAAPTAAPKKVSALAARAAADKADEVAGKPVKRSALAVRIAKSASPKDAE